MAQQVAVQDPRGSIKGCGLLETELKVDQTVLLGHAWQQAVYVMHTDR